jgi:serine/threonine protein kinase
MDPTATQDMLQTGQVIGGSTIESFVAAGGMGLVYKARKKYLDKVVALKVLKPHLATVPSFLARFLREGKVASRLEHPGIVKVFDVGEDGGRYYLVMEFVEGRNLLDVVSVEGRMPAVKALRIGRQVAEALAYAHERGVVHRDIKPGNIILTDGGDAKIADLGLARPIREDTEVTNPGAVVGTPVYMSPEQCRGTAIDARSDLYSLGATLYMLLGGKPPFRGDSTAALIHQVVNDLPKPLKTLAPDIPDKVVTIVQRMMAKHPVARFQTGHEIAEAIDQVILGRFTVASDARKKSTETEVRRFPWARLAGLVLVGTVLGTAAHFLRPQVAALAPGGSATPPRASTAGRRSIEPGGAASHSTSGPLIVDDPEEAASPAPRPREGDASSLAECLTSFRDGLASGDLAGVLACFEPSVRSQLALQTAMAGLLEALESRQLRAGAHLVEEQGPEQAKTVIFFHAPKGTGTVGIPVEWYRRDGSWYPRPRTYSFAPGE